MKEIIVEVRRGKLLESKHRVHAVIVDNEGHVVKSYGDELFFTFWRSAAKPFQVLPLIELGGHIRFGFTPQEIAVMVSSHNGEQEHLHAVESILNKIGLSETSLDCGTAIPLGRKVAKELAQSKKKPTLLHNACSGKHAAALALAKTMDVDEQGYILPEHPVQKKLLEAIAHCTDLNADTIETAVDGCGFPVYALPLRNMAMAYARLAKTIKRCNDKQEAALELIREAMVRNPFYVAGSERICTGVMEKTGGEIVAKQGAEGIFCMGQNSEGLGVAIKVEDGAHRALDPVVVSLLNDLNVLPASAAPLSDLLEPVVRNHRKEIIGNLTVIKPC